MTRPRAFIESPAGLASVSLCLHGGRHCRPPISRTGNKAGFAPAILDLLGLRPGQGAGAYVWVEADPDVRALLRAYPDAALLREVAAIIRGWSDEEPRALWERLREERRARGTRGDAGGVAGWVWSHAVSIRNKGVEAGIDMQKAGGADATDTFGAIIPLGPVVAARCSRLADSADHGGAAREVAGWLVSAAWSFRLGDPGSGFGKAAYDRPWIDRHGAVGVSRADTCDKIAAKLPSRGGWPPVAILPTVLSVADLSALLGTPGDLDGVVVYMDPDYASTTGYKSADGTRLTYPRADVVRDALAYAAAGATVAVSEAVPVGELVEAGWEAVDIMGERRGQKLTFRRADTGEWVTMSRAPLHRPAVQVGMFAGGAA